MLVFLSWSGAPSRAAAEALRDWLPNVIQAASPWMSAEDIDKGARWSTDIAQQLAQAQVGVLCLTPENTAEPWILFEAGALSKALGKGLVCPYLLGLAPTDLKGPLVQFQAAEATKSDTLRLMQTINHALGEAALPDATLRRVFDKWWPDLKGSLEKIDLAAPQRKPRRGDRELLEEAVALMRQLLKEQQALQVQLEEQPRFRTLTSLAPSNWVITGIRSGHEPVPVESLLFATAPATLLSDVPEGAKGTQENAPPHSTTPGGKPKGQGPKEPK